MKEIKPKRKTYKTKEQVKLAQKGRLRKLEELYLYLKNDHEKASFMSPFQEKEEWLNERLVNDFYQGMDKKSVKQLSLDKVKARSEKIEALKSEFQHYKNSFKEEGLDEIFPEPNEEVWMTRKLEEWERHQPLFILGKYQDESKIDAIYQQEFVKCIKQLCQKILEEVRNLTPYFTELFGKKNNYNSIFDRHRATYFTQIQDSLRIEINSLLDFRFLSFPYQYKIIRQDYFWGSYKILFFIAYLLFIKENKRKDKISNLLNQELQNNLVYQFDPSKIPEDFDRTILISYLEKTSSIIIDHIISNPESYFVTNLKKTITQYVQTITGNESNQIESFIKLQVELMIWAESHNLEKDWLLHYAYFFMWQFSNNPNLEVSDIEVTELNIHSLMGETFEFKFNNWFPGVVSREDYEERLRESFEYELENYFQSTGRNLDLTNKKKSTNPRNFDRVKWLVRKTVQNWNEIKIVEIDFDIPNTIANKEIFSRKVKYLKEELPTLQEYNLPYKT